MNEGLLELNVISSAMDPDGVTLHCSKGLRFHVGVLCSRIDAPTLTRFFHDLLSSAVLFQLCVLVDAGTYERPSSSVSFVGLMVRINTSPLALINMLRKYSDSIK